MTREAAFRVSGAGEYCQEEAEMSGAPVISYRVGFASGLAGLSPAWCT